MLLLEENLPQLAIKYPRLGGPHLLQNTTCVRRSGWNGGGERLMTGHFLFLSLFYAILPQVSPVVLSRLRKGLHPEPVFSGSIP